MATYIVDSASVLSATTGADSVWVQSGGTGNSTVFGLAGNDTLYVVDATNTSSQGIVLRGAGGDDSIHIDSGSFSAGNYQVYAGDGADSIVLSGMGFVGVLNTNEGNDRISADDGVTISAANFGSGTDTINISGTIGNVGLGNGHDEFSGTVVTFTTANTLKLGDGRDTISIGSLTGNSAITIQGDSDTNFGADSMDLGVVSVTGLVVKGHGGADTITISGADASSLIQGYDVHDSIEISDALATDVTIGGGKGRDSIFISGAFAVTTTAIIFGGEAADSIFIEDITTGDKALTSIQGGGGADTITISGASSDGFADASGTYGTLVYSSFSESNLSATDLFEVVSAGGANINLSGAGDNVDVDFGGAAALSAVGTVTASNLAGNTTSYASVAADGVVTFAGDLATTVNSSVTAAVAAVDKTLTSEGLGALFTANGREYLFVQGGTAGTADDLVVGFGGISAKNLTDNGSAFQVNFSGINSAT